MSTAPGSSIRRLAGTWIGIVPFLIFAVLFILMPTANIVIGAFQDTDGGFTLTNMARLFEPRLMASFWLSIKVSLMSAGLGVLTGFLIAVAVSHGGLPPRLRAPLLTFSGVAANFAGVPLAFAFIATLGRLGFITILLKEWLGINIYSAGFNLISFWGLIFVYLYFQLALMLLIIMPALDGLKKEWREAAEVLGATHLQYWRMVALPVLFPALLGTFALLFANSFGAIATAQALTGSSQSLITIQLFAQIRGDVLQDPRIGYAIAFGMIVITGLANALYIVLRQRSEKWIK
ncbi:MAG: ABC transporter permease subunit [Rhodobacterales bacterium]|jgi:putative spermidine/putrescine transport system permease protein|nr:ABC transporter permease subunit [Rhodobacterales bacterium]